MGGRTMPTECPHGVLPHWAERRCVACDRERIERGNLSTLRWGVSKYPAEAVAQLVADGVLVPAGWRRGGIPLGDPRQRVTVERSRPDGEGWELMYGVVLPEVAP